MIRFQQSKGEAQRTNHFSRMLKFRVVSAATSRRTEEYKYFSTWYYPVILELIATTIFKGDYKKLSQAIFPNISPGRVKWAVETLENLGLVKRNSSGRYLCKRRELNPSGDFELARQLAERKSQKQIAKLAGESFDRFKPEFYRNASVNLSVSNIGFEKLCALMEKCRTEAAQIVAEDQQADRIYQMNMNLFPVSKLSKR
jgi:uncharacterized protein (TIGR02147 family)